MSAVTATRLNAGDGRRGEAAKAALIAFAKATGPAGTDAAARADAATEVARLDAEAC